MFADGEGKGAGGGGGGGGGENSPTSKRTPKKPTQLRVDTCSKITIV